MGETPRSITPKIPNHVAVIMDGNGRWAQSRGLLRVEGHKAGVKRVRPLVEDCVRRGIRYLTIFCFSTENWKRPELEVAALMKLFSYYLDAEVQNLIDNGVRLRAIGDRAKLPVAVQKALASAEQKTATGDKLDLILALSYGGREELVQAAKKIAVDVKAGKINPQDITAETISSSLYAPEVPDVDLLIRTSDEHRISNFLLWQVAYAEIVITSVLWPDFSLDEFEKCLAEFSGRSRRFGLTGEQIEGAQVQ
jgi:undecaprenyl diphosphate synthase